MFREVCQNLKKIEIFASYKDSSAIYRVYEELICLKSVRWLKTRRYNVCVDRVSNNERNESPETDGSVSPEPPDRPPGKVRQVHPEEKTQVLAYDSTYRKKNKPSSLPLEENHYNHLANANVAMSPIYPLTPNICVEGGKIEFIKSPPGSARNSLALASPPPTPLLVRRGSRDKREARLYDEPSEKFDGDKERYEAEFDNLQVKSTSSHYSLRRQLNALKHSEIIG